MAARRAKNPTIFILTVVSLIAPVITFFGGVAFNAWTIASNIATKTEVVQVAVDGRKYTDEKSAAMLQQAIAHSDANRSLMVQQIIELKGDIKSDLVGLKTQMNSALDTLDELKNTKPVPRRR